MDKRSASLHPAARQNASVARYDDLLFSSPGVDLDSQAAPMPRGWFRRLVGGPRTSGSQGQTDGFEMARIKMAAYH